VHTEGKRQLERPRHSWEDNSKMDHKEMVYGLDSTGSGQDAREDL